MIDDCQDTEHKENHKSDPLFKYIIVMWVSFMSIIFITLIFITRSAFSDGAKYLYHVDGDGAESFPIEDYLLPDNETIAEEEGNYEYMHPDFLFKPDDNPDFNPPPRIVEFYAPW